MARPAGRLRTKVAILITLAGVAGCSRPGARGSATRGSAAAPEIAQSATLTGCITRGDGRDDMLLVAVGDAASSSTADIAWQGTRQYTLVVPGELRRQLHLGQRVVATGTIVDPPGRGPSRVDQQQSAEGMPFREFRATALQPAEGPCRQSAEFGRDADDRRTREQ